MPTISLETKIKFNAALTKISAAIEAHCPELLSEILILRTTSEEARLIPGVKKLSANYIASLEWSLFQVTPLHGGSHLVVGYDELSELTNITVGTLRVYFSQQHGEFSRVINGERYHVHRFESYATPDQRSKYLEQKAAGLFPWSAVVASRRAAR